MFIHPLTITPSDLEPHYNHVHHAHALEIMEQARLAYLEKIGFPLSVLMQRDIFLVLTEISVKYRRELLAGPHIITCENPKVEGRTMSLSQRVFRDSLQGKAAIHGEFYFMCLSQEQQHAVTPPEELVAAFLGAVDTPPQIS